MGKPIEGAFVERWLIPKVNTVAAQMQEMEMVRQKVYELERNQVQIKQRQVPAAHCANLVSLAKRNAQVRGRHCPAAS